MAHVSAFNQLGPFGVRSAEAMTFPVLREVIPSDVTVEFRAILCMTMRWACEKIDLAMNF